MQVFEGRIIKKGPEGLTVFFPTIREVITYQIRDDKFIAIVKKV